MMSKLSDYISGDDREFTYKDIINQVATQNENNSWQAYADGYGYEEDVKNGW